MQYMYEGFVVVYKEVLTTLDDRVWQGGRKAAIGSSVIPPYRKIRWILFFYSTYDADIHNWRGLLPWYFRYVFFFHYK